MTTEKGGRLLDRNFEEGLSSKFSELKKEAKNEIQRVEKTAAVQKDKLEVLVKENPVPFILGAFVGGVIIGALISRRD